MTHFVPFVKARPGIEASFAMRITWWSADKCTFAVCFEEDGINVLDRDKIFQYNINIQMISSARAGDFFQHCSEHMFLSGVIGWLVL